MSTYPSVEKIRNTIAFYAGPTALHYLDQAANAAEAVLLLFPIPPINDLTDLRKRLERDLVQLSTLNAGNPRIAGKISGITTAIQYIDEALRQESTAEPSGAKCPGCRHQPHGTKKCLSMTLVTGCDCTYLEKSDSL